MERPVSSVPVDGQQTLSDLSAYPRIRASGDTMATVRSSYRHMALGIMCTLIDYNDMHSMK